MTGFDADPVLSELLRSKIKTLFAGGLDEESNETQLSCGDRFQDRSAQDY